MLCNRDAGISRTLRSLLKYAISLIEDSRDLFSEQPDREGSPGKTY
jgi:hypothetical protein